MFTAFLTKVVLEQNVPKLNAYTLNRYITLRVLAQNSFLCDAQAPSPQGPKSLTFTKSWICSHFLFDLQLNFLVKRVFQTNVAVFFLHPLFFKQLSEINAINSTIMFNKTVIHFSKKQSLKQFSLYCVLHLIALVSLVLVYIYFAFLGA